MPIRLLIDGNNLLHASDVFPAGTDRSTAAAQRALVQFLAQTLSPRELSTTAVVFDGPPDTLSASAAGGMQVFSPTRKKTADDLLEELIAKNAEPKRLLVVSSDHRVQRAARQAGAEYIDSEVYWRQVRSRPAGANDRGETSADKPASPAAEEVADWLREFRGGE